MTFPSVLQVCFLLLLCCLVATAEEENARSSTSHQESQFPTIPSIDLGPWMSSTKEGSLPTTLSEEQQDVVRQIHKACRTVGFFVIQNHGLDASKLWDTWVAAQAFFALSEEEKLRHKSTNEAEYPYGYEQSEQLVKGKQLDDKNDVGDGDNVDVADLKETFAIGPNKAESDMPLRRWVETPSLPKFQTSLESYYEHMEGLAQTLLQIFALALQQPLDYFDDKIDHHMSALRLVNYYPLTTPSNEPEVIRAGAHTDYGALTILNAQKAGLQVLLYDQNNRTNTQWYSVPVQPGALVINLGDLMQRWTNDEWVSTLHQVVMPSTDALERRYSMAYFVNVNGDTLVEPLKSCQVEGEEAKYPPITAKDHLMAKHLASMGGKEEHDEL